MRKHFEPLLILAICLLAFGCAAIQTALTPHQTTFDVIIDSKTYTIMLPEEIPDMLAARVREERCWDGLLCEISYCLSFDLDHDHVQVFYVPGQAPGAIVWTKGEDVTCWLYVKGVPAPVDMQQIDEFLNKNLITPKLIDSL